MAELRLRDYQTNIISDIKRRHIKNGSQRVLVWLPTGGGKTEIAVKLALDEQYRDGHTLFVVERKSLCDQAANRFRKYGMLTGIVQADNTFIRGYEPVTVASVQSLRARHEYRDVGNILSRTTQVIVDEAHILYGHHDKIMEALPDARFVGLTATPLRDGLGLRYDEMVRGPSYEWMIKNGYLVQPRYFLPHSALLQAGLKDVAVSSTGDYVDSELSRLMRNKTIIGDTVKTWKNKAEGRLTICFAVDIAHSKELCDEFNAAGITAEHIDCFTPDDERAGIFRRFQAGATKVLCSVSVLAIGFDEPRASCAILARPTLSLALHVQQLGRVLRPADGKQDSLVFDHALNVTRHGKIESFDPPELSEIDKRSDRKRKSDEVLDYRPCPQCAALLEPKQRECHECGHIIKRPNVVDFIAGELTESAGEIQTPNDDMQDFYLQLRWVAQQRGYADGWSFYKFKERYQDFKPPYGWRNLPTKPATDETMRWLKSRQIAWAKSKSKRPLPSGCKACGSTRREQGPGTGPHAAKWLCADCGAFLGWIAKSDVIPNQQAAQKGLIVSPIVNAPPPSPESQLH